MQRTVKKHGLNIKLYVLNKILPMTVTFFAYTCTGVL